MMGRIFPTEVTNPNRADAGSAEGLAGRAYPIAIAARLERDREFLEAICSKIRRKADDFNYAQAGSRLKKKVQSVLGGLTDSKTTLRIVWKDGRYTNFIVKKSGPAQIMLKKVERFIPEFEAQFGKPIPRKVKEALLLFIGRHPDQKKILDSISVNYVGERIRALERSYHDRLTLGSMYGYDEAMPGLLMNWLRHAAPELFLYCFSLGAAREKNLTADYLWYHSSNEADSPVEILDLNKIFGHMKALAFAQLEPLVEPRDPEKVGSTINLPFGNLQYHEGALQFRHDRSSISAVLEIKPLKKKTFGSRQKIDGHENERLIAKALNSDRDFRTHFCERVGRKEADFFKAEAGGAEAKQESSVLGGGTAGKTDITVYWRNGSQRTNISVKMSASGQVYLVSAKNFVAAYEAQYKVRVPGEVARALALFIGEAPDSRRILESTDISVDGPRVRKIAADQNFRLVYDVIYNYDPCMASALLAWLKARISTVCELCFSAGAVADRSAWSDFLWYKNLVKAGDGLDYMVPIKRLIDALDANAERNIVEKGPLNGGSTIHLPFGHLQYHLKQLEFYQKMKKIQELLDSV